MFKPRVVKKKKKKVKTVSIAEEDEEAGAEVPLKKNKKANPLLVKILGDKQ